MSLSDPWGFVSSSIRTIFGGDTLNQAAKQWWKARGGRIDDKYSSISLYKAAIADLQELDDNDRGSGIIFFLHSQRDNQFFRLPKADMK